MHKIVSQISTNCVHLKHSISTLFWKYVDNISWLRYLHPSICPIRNKLIRQLKFNNFYEKTVAIFIQFRYADISDRQNSRSRISRFNDKYSLSGHYMNLVFLKRIRRTSAFRGQLRWRSHELSFLRLYVVTESIRLLDILIWPTCICTREYFW